MNTHAKTIASYPDGLLQAVIADGAKRNLRDLTDHVTRWWADRTKACRAECRRRGIPSKPGGRVRKP